jgi:hypothetical protein
MHDLTRELADFRAQSGTGSGVGAITSPEPIASLPRSPHESSQAFPPARPIRWKKCAGDPVKAKLKTNLIKV